MSKDFSRLLLGGCFIISVSFLTFLPSFNLALYGDDWLAIWRYLEHLGPKAPTPDQWNHFTYFLTPYGTQDILMGFLSKLFGFQSFYYYFLSFILRLFAAFTLYPLVFYLTKNKLATFFSVLFFSITVIGLETTNWVFNMPSYVTIGLFNLALYFFVKSREKAYYKHFLIAVFLYYIAYIITPIRMHGSLPFLFLLDLFWFIRKRDLKTFKFISIRLSLILTVFLIIRFTGHSLGPSNEVSERLNQGLNTIITLLSQWRPDVIYHPLIIFGSMLVPDFLIQQLIGTSIIDSTIFMWSLLILFFFTILSIVLTNISKDISKKFFLRFFLFSLMWTLISWIIFPKNVQPFPNNSITPAVSLILFYIGSYTFILELMLLWKNRREENISTALLISLVWPFLSFFAAWWFTPQVIFPTSYRYLTVSVVGISIFMGIIIYLGDGIKKQLLLAIILSPFLLLHITSTNYYLKTMEGFRSQQIANKVWSSIPYIAEVGKEPLVFYFEADSSNYIHLYNTITFGFPPHMQLLYGLSQYDFAPVPMENWNQVVSAIKDGQSFKPYGYPLKPIPIDHVYGFRLEDRDNLINITDLVRQKLANP